MEKEIKREAIRQYLHYFRFWFSGVGVLALILAGLLLVKIFEQKAPRGNREAPAERVYDYAEVLTQQEEEELRSYIASREKKYQIDIVVVTIKEDVEKQGDWETAMMNLADDFYDENNYGYDKVHGDGILLLDNWYEGQEGSHVSTCGSVYEKFGYYEIDEVLDAVYERVEQSPFAAYKAFVQESCRLFSQGNGRGISTGTIIIIPAVTALVYTVWHLMQKKAQDTATALSFVSNKNMFVNQKQDAFIRKAVTSRRIETGSSSGGKSSGGGGHTSSGGVRHGGGGRRR